MRFNFSLRLAARTLGALALLIGFLALPALVPDTGIALEDSDGDLIPDSTEIFIGTDPNCADSEDTLEPPTDGLCNGNGGDGLTDFDELVTYGTHRRVFREPKGGDAQRNRQNHSTWKWARTAM